MVDYSPVLARILKSDNRIPPELPSGSQVSLIDDQLDKAGALLAINGRNLINKWLLSMLVLSATNTKNTFICPREEKYNHLDKAFSIFVNDKFSSFSELKFDRGYPLHMLYILDSIREKVEKLPFPMSAEETTSRATKWWAYTQARLGFKKSPITTLRLLSHYIKLANEFRSIIIGCYFRLSWKMVVASKYAKWDTFERIEQFNNLTMVVGRTVDRFDQNRGALAPSIQLWLRGASVDFGPQNPVYDLSYSIHGKVTILDNNVQSNIAIPLDDTLVIQDSNTSNEIILERFVCAMAADPIMRFALLASNFDFQFAYSNYLKRKDLSKLQATIVNIKTRISYDAGVKTIFKPKKETFKINHFCT